MLCTAVLLVVRMKAYSSKYSDFVASVARMVNLPNFIKSMLRLKELYLQDNEFTDIGESINLAKR